MARIEGQVYFPESYELLGILGRGSFGCVYHCRRPLPVVAAPPVALPSNSSLDSGPSTFEGSPGRPDSDSPEGRKTSAAVQAASCTVFASPLSPVMSAAEIVATPETPPVITYESVAVKRIENYAHEVENGVTVTDSYRELYLRRVCREVEILLHFRGVPQIIEIKALYLSPNRRDLYIVMSYVPLSLHALLKEAVYTQQLRESHARWIVMQILIGLHVLHSARCLHRDLSTGNILINPENFDVVIADFGLSRVKQLAQQAELSLDVVTLPYRAPEVLMQCGDYGSKLDIWSAGCIAAELLFRHLFIPDKDVTHQLQVVMEEITGFPDLQEWEQKVSPQMLAYLRSAVSKPAKPDLKTKWRGLSPEASSVLQSMLELNPDRRPSAAELLKMAWFQSDTCCQEAIEQGNTVASAISCCPSTADACPANQLTAMVAKMCTAGLPELRCHTLRTSETGCCTAGRTDQKATCEPCPTAGTAPWTLSVVCDAAPPVTTATGGTGGQLGSATTMEVLGVPPMGDRCDTVGGGDSTMASVQSISAAGDCAHTVSAVFSA